MKIVQFIHPGHEFPVSDVNSECRDDGEFDVMWSTEQSHHRRLVRHHGSYVDDRGTEQTGDLAFWTEWEGPTVASKIFGARGRVLSHFVHKVKHPTLPGGAGILQGRCGNVDCSCPADDDGPLNTDPCVFGNSFKYALCQQSEGGVLRTLEDGSLIFFVSRIAGTYYLDTTFAVGTERIDYSSDNTAVVDCSDEYRALTLDRIPCGQQFTFYRGKRFANMQDIPFSFTPAKIWRNDASVGVRCCLDVNGINAVAGTEVFSVGLKQKFKTTDANQDVIRNVWNEIVQQVRRNGFVLGVHFPMPQN